MEATHLLAFNAVLLAAIVSPGPALLYALRTTLAEGRVAGLMTGAGLALVAALWTTLAFLGLDRLFALVPWAYFALKVGGAAYLIWVGVATWRGARRPIAAAASPRHGGHAILRGAAVNLANPKSVLFAGSVLLVVFPPDLPPAAMALVVGNHLAVELAFYGLLATLLSRPAPRAAYLGARAVLDRIAGAVMVGLGLRLLSSSR